MPKPHRFVLEDWSAGVKGATQTIYADNRQPDIVRDDARLLAQTGPVPYWQSTQSFIHGEGGYKIELGIHVFELPASCNDEANVPVHEIMIFKTPSKDRWSGYPSMVGYDPAYDSTIPKPYKIVVYNEDSSIHCVFEMDRDGKPINDPSLGQTRNETTAWRPFSNVAQVHYHCSHRLKMSSDARRYYAGTNPLYWMRPKQGKSRPYSNPAIPNFGTTGNQIDGFAHFLMMPEWSLTTSTADWDSLPKTDPYADWAPSSPTGNATDGAKYPTNATGWHVEHGAYAAGHEPRRGAGGQRFDRFPVPSQLAYVMTEPDGVRLQGNVPWRTLWDNYAAGFFNLSYHHVRNAKTLEMLPFSEVAGGQWGHFHGYYNGTSVVPSDPQNWIDLFGLTNGEPLKPFNYDRDGLFPYSGYVTDTHHSYDVPGWHTTHFNSMAASVSQRLRYYAMVMAFNKYYAKPTDSPAGTAANNTDAMIFQRQHAWRWLQMLFLWKTAGSGPLVPRADVEAIWKLHLETMHDEVVVPATTPADARYDRPLFAGLRNLGLPVRKVVSGSNHYLQVIDDDKKYYFFGVVTLMRTMECFDRLRELSPKCAAALDFVVACYQKYAAHRLVATKGRQQYGTQAPSSPLTPTIPTTTEMVMPANWAVVAATMQPQDNSDMVRNADGSPFLGAADNYNVRERWQYQHLLQQTCYSLQAHFADYPDASVSTAVTMLDEYESYVATQMLTDNREWGQRFIAAGPMLVETSTDTGGGETPPTDPDPDPPPQPGTPMDTSTLFGGAFASVPFGAFLITPITDVTVPVVTVTAVNITPASANLAGLGTQQFSHVVLGQNSPGQGVTWTKISGPGTVSASGLYTGPASLSTTQTAVLRATSQVDPQVYAEVTVTIAAVSLPPPDPDPTAGVHTVNVTILAADQQGNRMAGAYITCVLNKVDVDDVAGYIAPEEFEVQADAQGKAVLALWPNVRGSRGSFYIFVIENPDTGQAMRIDAVVPDQDCYLHQIAVPVG